MWDIISGRGKGYAMSTLLNTNIYDYTRVLDKAADAAWIRNDCINNNLANVNTPGYKREDVDFKAQLQQARREFRYMTPGTLTGRTRIMWISMWRTCIWRKTRCTIMV